MPNCLETLRRVSSTVGVIVVASLVSNAAGAQLAPLPVTTAVRGDTICGTVKQPTGPRFVIAPYGWMVGVHGETGIGDRAADVNVRFSDILHHLRFAAMGNFEVGYNSWLGIADVVYASLRADHSLAHVRTQPDIDATLKLFIGQAFVGYSFRPEKTVAIDLLVGTRIWGTRTTLGISGDIVNRARENSGSWADALGGLRVRWEPTAAWQVNVAGDGGGGGSKGTGEGLGSVNYSFATHWSAFAGYRYLYENRRNNDFFLKVHLDGPVLGAAYRW